MSSITIFLVLLVVMRIADASILPLNKHEFKTAHGNETIPVYMRELYMLSRETDATDIPFDSVRCFLEEAVEDPSPNFYKFNTSSIQKLKTKIIKKAYLNLYKRSPSARLLHSSDMSLPLQKTRIYQVLPNRSLDEPRLHDQLHTIVVNADVSGWQILDVTRAVHSWASSSPNLGLLVTTTVGDHQIHIDYVRRNQKPRDKQPILIVIYVDNKPEPILLYSLVSPHIIYLSAKQRKISHALEEVRKTRKNKSKIDAEQCEMHDYFLNFEEQGKDFIVAPVRYNAYQCRGKCAGHCQLPAQKYRTNYDKINTAVQSKPWLGDHIPQRSSKEECCVPTSISDMWILRWTKTDEIVLQSFPNMIVTSCGCKQSDVDL
ncbi:bone morphogenetic protein 4 [Copidosoma floridanum]|uniref:bone morphogenetic protein 4 n=1 Tax=Copidosoma floridanum TaxID=29053 RepID=UPI0006C98B4C|nr:bone morphogenetic protein 4 [Copidosoma floridanum]